MRMALSATAALVLAVPLLATGPAAEAATCTAPELVSASVAPASVVLGISLTKGFVVRVGVRQNGCAVSHVDTEVLTPSGVPSTFRLDEEETTDGVTTYDVGVRVDPGAVGNGDAGAWTSAVHLTWAGTTSNAPGPGFRIVRAARLSADATPEPVHSGKALTVRGTLKRADWATLHYAAYPGRRVELQFRTSGGAYRTVTTATTGRDGKLAVTVRATRGGCYRFVFRGSSTTTKVASHGDCVDVR